MGKKNRRKNENALEKQGVFISEEEHQRYIAFCALRDKLFETVEELDESWQDHCRLLMMELQIDLSVVDSTVDTLITKLLDMVRNVKYIRKEKKKKKGKFFVPLSGGIGKSHENKNVINIQSKKSKKAEVSFELISSTDSCPIIFPTFYPFEFSDKCKHGNSRPCVVCDYIPVAEDFCATHGQEKPCMVCEGIITLC